MPKKSNSLSTSSISKGGTRCTTNEHCNNSASSGRGVLDLANKISERKYQRLHGHAGPGPNFRQRTGDQPAQAYQASIQHGPGRTANANPSGLDGSKGQTGCVQMVAQFVREIT
jgi:hypothetical protein